MAASLLCKELLVKVGYGNIACRLWGENLPATEKFIAVHGWLDNAGSFDPLMKHFLSKDRCVACVDLPGHGLSSHMVKGIAHSPATDTQALRSVVKQLGWTKYNLIGHSMGAMRVQMYGLCWPTEVISIVSLDGTIIPLEYGVEDADPYAAFARQTDKFLRFDTEYHGREREHSWEELAERWMTAMPGLTMEDFTILMKRGSVKLDNGKYIYNRDKALHNRTNSVLMYPTDTILRNMQKLSHAPLLVIRSKSYRWGEKLEGSQEDKMSGFLSDLTQRYPNQVEIESVDGPHHFHMQQPELVTNMINTFLSKHRQSSGIDNETERM